MIDIHGRMPDHSERLARIRGRVHAMLPYRFARSAWVVNAPGRTHRVVAYREGATGHVIGPDQRGPEAFFTSADDADQYAALMNDLLWLLAEYESLAGAMARNI